MPRIEAALKSGVVEETQVVDGNGTVRRVVNWVVTPEEDQQIREGYRCPFDMQVFREAFPESCPICALTPSREWFSPRKHQSEAYQMLSLGEHPYGPSDIDDYDFERDDYHPKTSVLLPGRDF